MTPNEVKKRALAAANAKELPFEDNFYPTLSRAVSECNRIRPRRKRERLNLTNRLPTAGWSEKIRVCSGDTAFMGADWGGAKAFVATVCGEGKIYVYDDDDQIVDTIEAKSCNLFKTYRYIAPEDVTVSQIAVEAKRYTTVESVTFYADVDTNDADTLPDEYGARTYDLTHMFPDLDSIYAIDTGSDRVILNQKSLVVPEGFQGSANIVYNVKMPVYNADLADREMALDDDLCEAVVLLVAWYLFWEDKPEIAEACKSSYLEMRTAILTAYAAPQTERVKITD